MDYESTTLCSDNPDAFPEELNTMNTEALLKDLPEESAPYEAIFRDLSETIFNKISEDLSCEITDCVSEGADFVFY